MGNTPTPDATWTDWATVGASGTNIGGSSRYIEYRADLSTTVPAQTPTLQDVSIRYSALVPDTVAPRISSQSPAPGATDQGFGIPVVVKFSKLMNAATFTASTLRLRAVGASSDVAATVSATGGTATLQPAAALAPNTTYQVTLSGAVTDVSGNALGSDVTWTFTTGWLTFTDSTGAGFGAGTTGPSTYVTQNSGGAVTLAPAVGAEFTGTSLPAGWSAAPWGAGGSAAVGGGLLTVDGAVAETPALYGPGRSLQFVATFSGDPYQHVGFETDFGSGPHAVFGTFGGGGLYARTAGVGDTLIPGNWLGAPHLFRIDWTASAVVYSIDGAQVASHAVAIAANMRVMASDYTVGGGAVTVAWAHLTPYAPSGSFASRVFDAGGPVTWNAVLWGGVTPAGTALALSVRMGNTPTPDATWTDFVPLSSSGAIIGGSSRYLQYQATLSTSNASLTPELDSVTARYTPQADTIPPTVVTVTPAPGATGADLLAPVKVSFSELMSPATISTSTFHLRQVGGSSDVPATVTQASGSTWALTPTAALVANASYQVTVSHTVTDSSGNALGGSDLTWTFTAGVGQWHQTNLNGFSAGAQNGTVVAAGAGGGVQLALVLTDDFNGTALSPAWATNSWAPAGGGPPSTTVSNSILSLAGEEVLSTQAFLNSGVEATLAFGPATYQHFGLATDLSTTAGNYWALFSTQGTTDTLFALVNAAGATQSVNLGPLPAGFHDYKIVPTTAGFDFYLDGTRLGSLNNVTFFNSVPLKVAFSAFGGAPQPSLQVDWVRVLSYTSSGTFTSTVFDATRTATWGTVSWTANLPAGTTLQVLTRSGNTAIPDGSWSAWAAVANGLVQSPAGRYLQYEVVLTTNNPTVTPTLLDITFNWT
jgi:hypothetical protein